MDQRENAVGGHLVGRDLTITNNSSAPETLMVRLRHKFDDERKNKVSFGATIDGLQYYQDPIDRVPMGLEKKLELGGRHTQLTEALRAKELFAKCLARHSLSESAQEVIAYCLGQIELLFKSRVTPMINQRDPSYQVDAVLIDQVIQPVLRELEGNFLGLLPQDLKGMVFYLTGNCFLAWHLEGGGEHVPPGT